MQKNVKNKKGLKWPQITPEKTNEKGINWQILTKKGQSGQPVKFLEKKTIEIVQNIFSIAGPRFGSAVMPV